MDDPTLAPIEPEPQCCRLSKETKSLVRTLILAYSSHESMLSILYNIRDASCVVEDEQGLHLLPPPVSLGSLHKSFVRASARVDCSAIANAPQQCLYQC